jgi:tRNA threonylcarbamoyladenosine biosynthesis protein TsaB
MPTLLIDTATDNVVVALSDNGQIVAKSTDSGLRAQSVLVLVDSVLTEAEIDKSELDDVAVGIGPGSFTGVRIGVATARGIASALSIPVIPVPSLAALAWPTCVDAGEDVRVWADIDAKRGERFVQSFAVHRTESGRDDVVSLNQLMTVSADELAETVAGDIVVSGTPTPEGLAGCAKHADSIAPYLVVPTYGREPDARTPVGALA